jgi:hypothetical protein
MDWLETLLEDQFGPELVVITFMYMFRILEKYIRNCLVIIRHGFCRRNSVSDVYFPQSLIGYIRKCSALLRTLVTKAPHIMTLPTPSQFPATGTCYVKYYCRYFNRYYWYRTDPTSHPFLGSFCFYYSILNDDNTDNFLWIWFGCVDIFFPMARLPG